jgi:hypothetical protein
MFRIRIDEDSMRTTLHVEGNLAGSAVDELRRIWVSLRNGTHGKETVVHLGGVRIVDGTGRKLLGQMHGWGTTLSGKGLMISPLIDEIISSGGNVW